MFATVWANGDHGLNGPADRHRVDIGVEAADDSPISKRPDAAETC